MTVALLSMGGIPPLAGFMAKYYIFANAISEGFLGLVIFAILMSLVGVYYYFKIIIAMYFDDETHPSHFHTDPLSIQANPLQNMLIVLCCLLLLVLGIFPQLVYNLL